MRRCEVCFAPLPPWAEAYLWPCVRGGLTVCADCFDTLVGSLSRRELAARLGAPGVCGGAQKKNTDRPEGQSVFLVGEDGFEPSKALPADLQSVPFGHSGIPPYAICQKVELVDGLEPPTC